MHGHTFLIRCVNVDHIRRIGRVLPACIRWRFDQVVATNALRCGFVAFPILTDQVLTVGYWLTVRGLIVDLNGRRVWRVSDHYQGVLVLGHQLVARGNGRTGYLILAWGVAGQHGAVHRRVVSRRPKAVPRRRLRNQIGRPTLGQGYRLDVIG